MAKPEPCTNWYGTRRHLSADLAPVRVGTGREGHALCSTAGNPVDVFDQEQISYWRTRYHSKPVVVANLPECKRCPRAAEKLEG